MWTGERVGARYGARAASRGVGSMLSHKLVADGTVGALNLYAARRDGFSDDDREAAYLLAIFAAMAMAAAREPQSSHGSAAPVANIA